MANIFFISDTHFSHANIIRLCNRGITRPNGDFCLFEHTDEMDNIMVQRWNERIGVNDTVYHLGDFSYKSNPSKCFYRLNGANKFLIAGNHDNEATFRLPWTQVYGKRKEYVSLMLQIDKKDIVLSHFAGRVWHSSGRGTWHLYGHSHGKLPPNGLSFDVSVEGHDYYPWSWDEIKQKMATLSCTNHPESRILQPK